MIIVKCEKKGCEGHLLSFNAEGKPYVLPNRTHKPAKIKLTKELKQRIIDERYSEPFATFMEVLQEVREGEAVTPQK